MGASYPELSSGRYAECVDSCRICWASPPAGGKGGGVVADDVNTDDDGDDSR